MTLKNATKKTILARNIIVAHTFKNKLFGLTLTMTPHAMLFHTRFGIHTFGMRYSLDVIVLDQHLRVVAMKKQLKPNRIFFWDPHFETVIELPSGTLTSTKTELGDKINIS